MSIVKFCLVVTTNCKLSLRVTDPLHRLDISPFSSLSKGSSYKMITRTIAVITF